MSRLGEGRESLTRISSPSGIFASLSAFILSAVEATDFLRPRSFVQPCFHGLHNEQPEDFLFLILRSRFGCLIFIQSELIMGDAVNDL